MPIDDKSLEVKAWTVHDLWAKYENVAMHFNDLLIRLRTQALAAVAAISTVVGIFPKADTKSIHITWEVAAAVFGLLIFFWVAIWVIDRCYYTRLLIGAVTALLAIEKESKESNPSIAINLSTQIEANAARPRDTGSCWERFQRNLGV